MQPCQQDQTFELIRDSLNRIELKLDTAIEKYDSRITSVEKTLDRAKWLTTPVVAIAGYLGYLLWDIISGIIKNKVGA